MSVLRNSDDLKTNLIAYYAFFGAVATSISYCYFLYFNVILMTLKFIGISLSIN